MSSCHLKSSGQTIQNISKLHISINSENGSEVCEAKIKLPYLAKRIYLPWVRLPWWLHSFIFFWAKLCSFFRKVPSQKLTARHWKLMVWRFISFWDDLFSGAMLVLGSVCVMCWCMMDSIHMDLRIRNTQIFPRRPPKQAPRQLPCGQEKNVNSRQFGVAQTCHQWEVRLECSPPQSWLCTPIVKYNYRGILSYPISHEEQMQLHVSLGGSILGGVVLLYQYGRWYQHGWFKNHQEPTGSAKSLWPTAVKLW